MAEKLSEQGLIVYRAMLDQLGFLKKQQWTITNYLALIYGAIFWLAADVKTISSTAKCFLTVLTIAAGQASAALFCLLWFNTT